MAGMYEIVGFDEIIGGGSYPPHSTQGYARRRRRRHHHHIAGALPALIAGLSGGADVQDLVAGLEDEESSGADLISGLSSLIAGGEGDPAEALMAIAGLVAPDVKNQVIRQAMERSFAPRTIDVQSRAARAPRRLALNFRQLAVPINTTVDLPTRPQLPFRPERLFVQSDIAGNFEIVDIIIGNRSQFAQATPMSARIAAETSFGFDLHMDTAMVAMDLWIDDAQWGDADSAEILLSVLPPAGPSSRWRTGSSTVAPAASWMPWRRGHRRRSSVSM